MQRAKVLVAQAAVLNWGYDLGHTKITGHVHEEGRRSPYTVVVTWDEQTEPGNPAYLIGACTCPVKRNCLHAAAVAIMALDDQAEQAALLKGEENPFQPPSQSNFQQPQQSEIDHIPAFAAGWVKQLTAASDEEKQKHDLSEAILYILRLDKMRSQSGLLIEPNIAHRGKTGVWSNLRPCSWVQLAQGRARHITTADSQLAQAWVALSNDTKGGPTPHLAPPEDPAIMDLLLTRIIGSGRAFFQNDLTVSLQSGEAREGALRWVVRHDSSQHMQVTLNDQQDHILVFQTASPWYLDTQQREAGKLTMPFDGNTLAVLRSAPPVSPDQVAKLSEIIAHIDPTFPTPQADIKEEIRASEPIPIIDLRFQKFKNNILVSDGNSTTHLDAGNVAILCFDYGFDTSKLDSAWQTHRFTDGKTFVVVKRNLNFEKATEKSLTELGFQPYKHIRLAAGQTAWMPKAEIEKTWLTFVQEALPQLQKNGWQVKVEDSFDFRVRELSDDFQVSIDHSAGFWFSLSLGIDIDGKRVSLLPIIADALRLASSDLSVYSIEKLNINGNFFARHPQGGLLAIPFERIRGVLQCLIELLARGEGYDQNLDHLSISLAQITGLIEAEKTSRIKWHQSEKFLSKFREMKDFNINEPADQPEGLPFALREYQRLGLRWLEFLARFGLGGILADDMGLGKTVQALAHILKEKESGRLDHPVLIVCPTSVLPNWLAEAKRLTPSLKTLSLCGNDRGLRFDQIGNADIVFSTYPLLVRDAEQLTNQIWQAVILDEAQAIKNSTTKVALMVLDLKSDYRICLTGTPLENKLEDLWSHFNFLMPGFLSTKKDFSRTFSQPIESENNTDLLKLLSSRVRPFMLRRTKKEVAKDLPEKIEILKAIELEGDQLDLYESVRLSMHEKVLAEVKDKGLASSKLLILDALMKLRQVCCDPRLVKLDAAKDVAESAKLAYLKTMLLQLVAEKRKVLVFSQFTGMLDLIAEELRAESIPYVELRGDTADRAAPVNEFQNTDVPIFLISLKAGGVGLNLTAADTVILYDPWWNPAVEDQATDRAHRIGQEKTVFVYRLIAAGTIEQRMIELQDKKRILAANILAGTDTPESFDTFSEDELTTFFSPLQAKAGAVI